MKTQIYILIALALSFFLTACGQEEKSFITFPETVQLSAVETRQIETGFMRYPFRVRASDSCLYFMDLHGNEYYAHQFAYPSMRYIRSFARKGKGPGEFLDAENIRLNRQNELWLLDANKAKMSCFCVEGNSILKAVSLAEQLIRSLDFDLYQDSLFIVPDYTGTRRFDILHSDGSIKESRGQIPIGEKDKDIPDAAYAQAWRGFLSYNPGNGLLAIATQLGEVIEIYSLPGDSLVNVIYGKEGKPYFYYRGGYAIPDGIMGYGDVFVGNTNIYAIFWGHSFKDIKKGNSIEGGNRIHIFDLVGNPVKQLVLDRYITGFCVNEEKGIIIGVDANSDQPVVEWSMR